MESALQTPVVFLTLRSMLRLTTIIPLLFLALFGVQASKFCGNNRRNQCLPHHLCGIGFEDDRPVVDYQKLQTGNQGCASTEVCCPANRRLQENSDYTWMNPSKQTDCGQVNARGVTFTMRSADGLAQEHELPWMTALLHVNGTYLGGGSLVALDVVLTASHVISNFESNDFIVRAGEWDVFAETEKFPHVDFGVRMIVHHPSFVRRTGANNLALLFLEQPFQATHHIRPICLPSINQNFDMRRCIVSGWGKDANQNSYMNIMKKVDLPIVSTRTCEAQLRLYQPSTFKLHESLLCAGGERGRDACLGDGGSPLACPLQSDPTRFEQAGIVNWGIGCGMERTPAVYTDVAKFRTWIDDQIILHSNAMDGLILDDDEVLSSEEDFQGKPYGSSIQIIPEHIKTYQKPEAAPMAVIMS